MYAIVLGHIVLHKKAKGISKVRVKREFTFNDYKSAFDNANGGTHAYFNLIGQTCDVHNKPREDWPQQL
jgi:hypothetical protein